MARLARSVMQSHVQAQLVRLLRNRGSPYFRKVSAFVRRLDCPVRLWEA